MTAAAARMVGSAGRAWSPAPLGRRSRAAVLAIIVLVLTLISATPGVAPTVAAAANDGIDIRTVSTYTLVPDRGTVRVVIDLTARNTTPDVTTPTGTTRFYFTKVHVAVQPEAVAIRATASGASLATAITRRTGFQEVEVGLHAKLYLGRTVVVRIAYELPGGPPRSASGIRVGRAFATFVAWGNGDQAVVRVVLPSTFDPSVTGGPMATSTAAGRTVLSAEGITDTAGWYARIDAARPSALLGRDLTIAPGQRVSVRAWPEDPTWLGRVSDRLARGLPVLDGLIGLTWPVDGALEVEEVHTPLLEGYAGIYRSDSQGIEISEDLDDLTVLHEASHAWFNDGLITGRWIAEGLADTYATTALDRIGVVTEPPYPYPRNDPAAFPLNDWPPLGRIADDATRRREDYGYQTSFAVVQRIVDLAGEAGMRAVFAAAANREVPYVGAGPVERLETTPDWRTLLDYLEERAGSAGVEAEFRRNVVDEADRVILDARAAARLAYARLTVDGRGWAPPYAVRGPMSDWRFPVAERAMTAGEAILETRDRIAREGDPLGLTAPAALRIAYESAWSDLVTASEIATDELGAIRAIRTAADRLAAPRDPLVVVGLVGEVPDRSLAEAKTAYAQNDLIRAVFLANAAARTVEAAGDRGLRAAVGIGGAAGLWFAIVLVAALAVRRRREAVPSVAGPGAIPGWRSIGPASTPDPRAIAGWRVAGTLASQSSPETAGPNGGVEPPVIEPFDGPPSASA